MKQWPTAVPPQGIKEFITYSIREILFFPSRWKSYFGCLRPILSALIWKRRINLVRSYLSIGLPWDFKVPPSYEPKKSKILKKILRAHRRGARSYLPDLAPISSEDIWFRDAISLSHTLFDIVSGTSDGIIPEARSQIVKGRKKQDEPLRVLYISHAWPGDKWNGYAIRTHKIVSTLKKQGVDVEVLCRPAPHKIKSVPSDTNILNYEGVTYTRAIAPSKTEENLSDYISYYAQSINQKIASFDPHIIQGASNFITGTAASIAAKAHNIPFIYEVRGLWELTRLVTHPDYKKSVGFKAQALLETACASSADKVLTLNEALKHVLIERGTPIAKIDLLPNCGDLSPDISLETVDEDVQHLKRILGTQDESRCLFGYVGSLTDYEGLFILLDAFEMAYKSSPHIELVIAGEGDLRAALVKHIETLSAGSKIKVLGKLSPQAASALTASLDASIVARLANDVTRVVPPLKPLTAFSVGTPCILSDLPPLLDYVKEVETSLIVKAGSKRELANAMVLFAKDPSLRKRLGRNAQKWIHEKRNWGTHIKALRKSYQALK